MNNGRKRKDASYAIRKGGLRRGSRPSLSGRAGVGLTSGRNTREAARVVHHLPPLPVPRTDWVFVQIGDYAIGQVSDGGFWIEHESGEGMHVAKTRMEKLIRDFYKENF